MELSKLSDGFAREYVMNANRFTELNNSTVDKTNMAHGSIVIVLGASSGIDHLYMMSHIKDNGEEDKVGHFVTLK